MSDEHDCPPRGVLHRSVHRVQLKDERKKLFTWGQPVGVGKSIWVKVEHSNRSLRLSFGWDLDRQELLIDEKLSALANARIYSDDASGEAQTYLAAPIDFAGRAGRAFHCWVDGEVEDLRLEIELLG